MKDAPHFGLSESSLQPSKLDFPVVGIGASAGGVTALQAFFQHVPADCGMAFVVVLHMSPDHASNLAAILQSVSALPVLAPSDPVALERNHVYVIGPHKLLAMNDSYLSVGEFERARGHQATIDLFFRTLAIVLRERAFAVILSGTGSDGAVGIARIKEEGGITFVQTPAEAEFDGMPRAAIGTGTVDWVLPVADMPAKLMELWRNARRIELPEPGEPGAPREPLVQGQGVKEAEEALKEVLMLVLSRTGHDFRNYKRATILRRIERRMQVHGLPNLPAYRDFIQSQTDEATALLKDLLIGVTNFFRDDEAFDALQREVIRPMVEQARQSRSGLRAWVPGCATGEEAYSLAMLFCEEGAHLAPASAIHLFATDIDETAIGVARLGCYPSPIEADVSAIRLRRFFDKEGGQYRIRKEVREKVMFAAHNILRDPPFSKLDIISCRNLLIYLDRDVHAKILEMFHFALKPGGYLFLGSSESADTASQLFLVVDKKNRIFKANTVARIPRDVSALPVGLARAGPAPATGDPRPDKRRLTYAEVEDSMSSDAQGPDAEGRDALVAQLEEELRRVKEQLQSTIEQSETSTEELKASNEELQAMNEELRSTTEELKTTKDELQSINEELITVNHELKTKIEETGKINDDLQNLISSTDIATVFVDRATLSHALKGPLNLRINERVDLSRLEAGRLTLARVPIDLAETVRLIVELMSEPARRKGIAVDVRLPDVPIMIDADLVRVEQIVWNLLDNAIRFTPRGGRIDVCVDAAEGKARLRVQDSGQGIDAQRLPHLFDATKDLGDPTVRRRVGFGIGLALVHGLVLAHGGSILVESRGAGHGSIFTVNLPSTLAGSVSQNRDSAATRLKGVKALLVDADAASAEALRQLLELEGLVVEMAASGEQALRAARSQAFDVVLCDAELPDAGTRAFLGGLRALPSAAQVPVLALSASAGPDVEQDAVFAFAGWFAKPVMFDQLLHRLRELKV